MNILENSEINSIIDKWAKLTQQKVIDNLKRRGLVAQLPIVNDVTYTINNHNNTIHITFNFDRKDTQKIKAQTQNGLKKLSIFDPLTGTYKEFVGYKRDNAKLGFLRKANVYELIKGKYANELINNILGEIPEIAGNILVSGL